MTAALSLLAGVLLGLSAASHAGPAFHGAAAVLIAAWLLSPLRVRSWARVAAMLLAGQLLSGLPAARWLDLRVPVAGADDRRLVEGVVTTVPARDGATLHFELRGAFVHQGVIDSRDRRLRIQWRTDHAAPRAGERWRLLVRLMPLEETRNFSGHDAARQAFRAGVHAAGRVLPSAMNELLVLAPASLNTVRARIALRVRDAIADPEAAALVTALAVGLTANLSRDQWRVFNATGTTHLVAISGMHVTLFAWLAFRAGRMLWRWLPLPRWVEREPFALLSGLASAGGYALLAGWSVPTQRTWLMLSMYVVARLAARQVGAGQLWSMALVLVLLTDPLAPLAAGFWLSFVAVGVLLAFDGSGRRESAEGWSTRTGNLLRVQFAIMFALAPAVLAVFGNFSLVGLAVNLLAIPIISLLFVPVVLAGALTAWLQPAWSGPCFAMAATMHDALWPALVWCADLQASSWRVSPPIWWFALAVPAVIVGLCRWPWPLRATALCVVLPLLFPSARVALSGTVRASVIDAGRGTAILLQTPSRALLFDTGDTWHTGGSRLAAQVLPALDAAGIPQVDLLVLPALNEDRARAAALLAMERGIGRIHAGSDWPGSGLPVQACRDSRWTWDGVSFELRMAGRGCTLRMATGGAWMLLGAEPGSSIQWIESSAPGLAVATGGIDGAQSRARALESWRRRGYRVLDTHRDGALELELAPQGVAIHAVARSSRYPFHWRRS